MHSSDFSTKILSEHKNTIHNTYYYTVYIYITYYTSNVSSTNYHDVLKYPRLKYPKDNEFRIIKSNIYLGHKIHILMQNIIIYLEFTILYTYFVIILNL